MCHCSATGVFACCVIRTLVTAGTAAAQQHRRYPPGPFTNRDNPQILACFTHRHIRLFLRSDFESQQVCARPRDADRGRACGVGLMMLRRGMAEFLCCENGLAATEYAVMTSLIIGGLLLMMTAFGNAVLGLYITIRTAFAG